MTLMRPLYHIEKIVILCLLMLFNSVQGCSQNNAIIKGRIKTAQNVPILSVKVSLYSSADSNCIWYGETDSMGIFNIKTIHNGFYFLTVKSEGWEDLLFENLEISDDTFIIDLGDIILNPIARSLAKVSARGKRPLMEREAGKIIYNVENNITMANSTLFEILERIPGVTMDRDGNLCIKGKRGVLIMIDGKLSGISGQELINLLKSTPSGNIQKIEVISSPAANYDASGTAGIIHIVFKKNKQDGFNISLNSGLSQGRYTKSNNGINIGYKGKKVNLNSNYSYSDLTGFTNLLLNRKFYSSDSLMEEYRSNDYLSDRSKTHFSRTRADLNLSKKILFSVTGTLQLNKHQSKASGITDVLALRPENAYSTQFHNNAFFTRNNFSLNTELKKSIDTNGQAFSMNLDYLNYWEDVIQNFNTNYLSADGKLKQSLLSQSGQSFSNKMFVFRIDYTYPLGARSKLDAGTKTNFGGASSDIKTGTSNPGTGFDLLNSKQFRYYENIGAGYVNYSGKFKAFTIQAGIRGEGTGMKAISGGKVMFNRTYLQMFPSISVLYKLNSNTNLNFNAGRRIERPSSDQLNPYKRMLNPTTYLQGNLFLVPQTSNNIEFGYSYKDALFCSISHTSVQRYISEVLIQDTALRMTYQSVINLDKLTSTGIDIAFSKKINKRWMTNSTLLLTNGVYKGSGNNFSIIKRIPTFNINLSNTFYLSKTMTAECSFQYNYKNFYGNTIIQPNSNLTIGVQRYVLKKQGVISLNFTDILWNSYAKGVTDQLFIKETWTAKRDTRMVKLSFNYKFGQKKR